MENINAGGVNVPVGEPKQNEEPENQGGVDKVLEAVLQQNQLLQQQVAVLMEQQQRMTQQVQQPEEPKPPEPPEGFDPYQIHDPNTPSGRYWQEYQNWQRQQLKSELENEFKSTFQTELEKVQQQTQYEKTLAEFQAKKGMDYEEFGKFRQFLEDPAGVDLDLLYQVFKLKTGETQQQPPQTNPITAPGSRAAIPVQGSSFLEGLKKIS